MALGARSSDIASQFIVEAVFLSFLGGLLGTVIAVFVTMSLEGIFQWSTEISLASIVIAIIVAALLGVAASVYPARRAAELEPISALQHE
jgi:putative ABC transport system permease protein